MQLSHQPARVFRRGVTAAATFGLTVMLAVTTAPGRADTARPGAASPGAQCAHADALDPAAAVKRWGECPPSVVASTITGLDGAASEPAAEEKKRGSEKDDSGPGETRHVQRETRRARPAVALSPLRRRVCGPPYVLGNPLLGPAYLPGTGYLNTLLFGYIPYRGLTTAQFLAIYRNPTGWNFPPDDGFARNSLGTLLRFRTTLYPGQYIDRFGNEFGRFLGAGGTPFIGRALPPDSLNTSADDPAHLCNYHLYRVLNAFDVDGGPAAPWFQQPGGGLQFAINGAYLPAGATPPFIPWLVDHGYLQRVY